MAVPITWQNISNVSARDANYTMHTAMGMLDKAFAGAEGALTNQQEANQRVYDNDQDKKMLTIESLLSGAKTEDALTSAGEQVKEMTTDLSTANQRKVVDMPNTYLDKLRSREIDATQHELTKTDLELKKGAFARQGLENQDWSDNRAEEPMAREIRARIAAGDTAGAKKLLNDFSAVVTMRTAPTLAGEIASAENAAEDREGAKVLQGIQIAKGQHDIVLGKQNAALNAQQILDKRYDDEANSRKQALRDQGVTGTEGYMDFGSYKDALTTIRELYPDIAGDKLSQVAKGLFHIQEQFQKDGIPLPKDVVLSVALGSTDNFLRWDEGHSADIVSTLQRLAKETVMVPGADGKQIAANRWMRDYELNAAVEGNLASKRFDGTVQAFNALNIPLTDNMKDQLAKRKREREKPPTSKQPASITVAQKQLEDRQARAALAEREAKAQELLNRARYGDG